MSDAFYRLGQSIGRKKNNEAFSSTLEEYQKSKQQMPELRKGQAQFQQALKELQGTGDTQAIESFRNQLSDTQSQMQRPQQLLQKLAQINPEATNNYLAIQDRAKREQEAIQQKEKGRISNIASTILNTPEENRADIYQYYRQKEIERGGDVSNMPEEYGAEADFELRTLRNQGRTSEKVFEGGMKESQFAETEERKERELKGKQEGTKWEREKFKREQDFEKQKFLTKQEKEQSRDGTLTLGDTTKLQSLRAGKEDLKSFMTEILDKDGSINKTLLSRINAEIPFVGGYRTGKASDLYSKITSAIGSKLRLESGAVISKDEIKEEMKKWMPRIGDDTKTAKDKLQRLYTIMDETDKKFTSSKTKDIQKEPQQSNIPTNNYTQDQIQAELQRRGLI